MARRIDESTLPPEQRDKLERRRAYEAKRYANDPTFRKKKIERAATHYAANRERKLEYARAYRTSPEVSAKLQEYESQRSGSPARRASQRERYANDPEVRKRRRACCRAYNEAHAASISSRNRARWRECISPCALQIIAIIEALKTHEQREQYACWLTLLADYDSKVHRATTRNTQIDHFLADFEEATCFQVYGLTPPAPLEAAA